VCIEDLDPVAVGVLDEGQSLHAAVVGLLHEVHAKLLEAAGKIASLKKNRTFPLTLLTAGRRRTRRAP